MHSSFFSFSSLCFILLNMISSITIEANSLFKSVCSQSRIQNYGAVSEASFCFRGSNFSKSLPSGLNECIWQEKQAGRKRESFCEHKYLGKSAMM